MNNFILKVFGFVKSTLHFLKIILLLLIISIALYWVQMLISTTWGWAGFMNSVAVTFVNIGDFFTKFSFKIFGVTVELKYIVAFITVLFLYFCDNLLIKLVNLLENIYTSTRTVIRKCQETCFNNSIQKYNKTEQKKIKKYKVYIETSIKKNIIQTISLDEQNKIMNKFLSENFNIIYTKYKNGFLYSFNDFDNVDNTIDILFKLLKSKAPIDYRICIQIFGGDAGNETEFLNDLIKLNSLNKITTKADTIWRYQHNNTQKYNTSLVGLFKKDGSTFEVHEFLEKTSLVYD